MVQRTATCPNCGQDIRFELEEGVTSVQCSNCQKRLKLKSPNAPAVDSMLPPGAETPPQSELPEEPSDSSITADSLPPAAALAPDQAQESTPAPTPVPTHVVPENPKPHQIQTGNHDRVATRRRGIGAQWLVLLSTVGIVVVVGTLVGVYLMRGKGFEVSFQSVEQSDEAETIVKKQVTKEIHWINADTKSARLSLVKVKITAVDILPVRARDANAQIQTSGDTNFLHVFVTLTNENIRDVDYTSWYGNEFQVAGKDAVAMLTDSEGTTYQMMVFDDVTDIKGHTPRSTMAPSNTIKDMILFELPEDFDVDKIDYWRLTLPGAAFGHTGKLYFEIPRDMYEEDSGFDLDVPNVILDDEEESSEDAK